MDEAFEIHWRALPIAPSDASNKQLAEMIFAAGRTAEREEIAAEVERRLLEHEVPLTTESYRRGMYGLISYLRARGESTGREKHD